jgi:hypothetical protein
MDLSHPVIGSRAGCAALAMGALLALGGCADQAILRPPAESRPLVGMTSAGLGTAPECAGLELEIHEVESRLIGRAFPVGDERRGAWADVRSSWWVDGITYPDGIAAFSIREMTPLVDGPRPFSLWRGRLADGRLEAAELPEGCGRTAVVRLAG